MTGPEAPGLLQSLRRLLATSLETAQVRLDLLAVELEQEKRRLLAALLLAALALLLLGVGLVLTVALLLLLLQEGYRLAALALLSLAFLGGGVALAGLARGRLVSPGGIAAATRGELARDRAALGGAGGSATMMVAAVKGTAAAAGTGTGTAAGAGAGAGAGKARPPESAP